MNRIRLYDFRISGAPESCGICFTDIARVANLLNEAQQRLLTDPNAPDEGWWAGYARYAFTVNPPFSYIVTPREVARIILMDVCKQPLAIKNEFFEFLEFGRGFQPVGCEANRQQCGQIPQAYERETVTTINDFVAGNSIRIYPLNSVDVGKRVLIQGTDTNNKTIYGTSLLTGNPILGESMVIEVPFTDTTNTFNTVTHIQKEQTNGDVVFHMVDQFGNETPLTSMEATEQTALYRKYFLNGLQNRCCGQSPQQVLAMCKLDYIPAQSDQDYLLIQSLPALVEECMAVRYSRMDTPGSQQMAAAKHARALQLLFGQLDHFLGKQSAAITVPLFGNDRLRLQPI